MERERPGRDRGTDRGADRRNRDAALAEAELLRKTNTIMESSGLPQPLAKMVAGGQLDLNEAIKRLAFQDEVNSLIQRHNFNRALATQIALGQVSKDSMLARRRVEEHLLGSRNRSILEEAKADGRDLSVGLHGHRNLRVRVLAVDRYEADIRDLETNQESRVHKLQFKFAFASADFKKVRKAMGWDKVRKDKQVEPVLRPQDRYACSDRRLGLAMDKKGEVTVTTLEGEVFSGQVGWVSRFELGLRTRQGVEVVIFRHALDDFRGD